MKLSQPGVPKTVPDGTVVPEDPESRLARGERLRVRALTLRMLELIPGISQQAKRMLVEEGPLLASEPDYESFQSALRAIPGIGATTARKLGHYLAPDALINDSQGCNPGGSPSGSPPGCRPEEIE
jgi:hypothetical protein